MNPLIALHENGQSYWLDNLTRGMLRNGALARRVREAGLRGVTSNPAIFDRAISGGEEYDEQIEELVRAGLPVEEIYEHLAVDDVRSACDVLRPVFDESGGADGFVSLEVSPYLLHDTEATVAEARRLFDAVARPNVLIKIPGSEAGVPAIEESLYRGINVNVTLLFSIEAYEEVAHAYLAALERRAAEGLDVAGVASVASFFLSRIDVLVDHLLGQRIRPGAAPGDGPRPERLLGRAAIANAKLAYQSFLRIFSGPRWEALAAKGARVQRVLWASTSTKNPLYRDVRYVEPLIGPDTVNTLPDETIDAFADHGRVAPGTIEEGVDEAHQLLDDLEEMGIDVDAVTWQLLNEGMEKFVTPYDDLMRTLEAKREAILGAAAARQRYAGKGLDGGLRALAEARFGRRLHARDTALWTDDEETARAISNRLGWLDAVATFGGRIGELQAFAREVKDAGLTHVVLLGMGGSSLWPEVASRVFGPADGWPDLHVLDSTDPEAVRASEEAVDLERTLFVVSSKSGTTTETLSFYRHFFSRLGERLPGATSGSGGGSVGERFVAITDPGSPLVQEAREHGFRRVFENPPDFGGRYSALSDFGLVPMALLGLDLEEILERTARQAASCSGAVPPGRNPGLHLGTVLGLHARAGRDKVTFVIDPPVAPFAYWVEQLLAESTGKEGRGLVPVEGEPLGTPEDYGSDRVFVALELSGVDDPERRGRLQALQDAGHPVVRIALDDRLDLGAEIFRWEVATATAGAILGVNPFDEPNVTESKENTRELLAAWRERGSFDEPAAAAEAGEVAVWTGGGADGAGAGGEAPAAVIAALLASARAGDYVALLPYFRRTPERHRSLETLRRAVRDRYRVATTLGYGPRYLHSTGQLHKGGPDTGVYLIFTAGSGGDDISIPDSGSGSGSGSDGAERGYGFATLLRAQALGDFRSLAEHGRRVVRIHLEGDLDEALATLVDELT